MSSRPTQPIDAQRLYRLADLMAHAGIGKAALRSLRRQGLQVCYVGSVAFVLGAHFIDAVLATSKPTKDGGPGRRREVTHG